MKKLFLIILAAAVSASSHAQMKVTASTTTLNRADRPQPGPAPEIKLGKTESFTLPNGMRVFVVENHKLPLVTASIQLDIYPELEGDMAGYSEFLSELLTAGTKSRSKDKLNEEIDFIGARLSATATGMFGQSLKKHQEKMLELMGDIAMNANFTSEELEKIRTRSISGLQAAKNEPDQMLENVTSVINFGKKHPYGEVADENTVAKVTLDKVKSYYKTYYRPNVAYMAVVGDVTMKEVQPLIEKYFGKWEKAVVPKAQYPNATPPTATHVALVPRDEAVQSVINVTYPIDLLPGHDDVVKARVANAILGGGSMGRLFMNLRETHAWTYGSYSSISQDDLKGNFTAYAKCRNAVTDSSVAEILKEMTRMRDEKISEKDLQDQIKYMSGSFAIGLESPQTVAQYAINIERYKMPKDYYTNYLKNLSAVTTDDIQQISRKYIDPAKANIIVVGSKSDVADKLKRFDADGKIALYDNYGNPLAETKTAAAPAGITADQVMKNYVKAIGGEKAINSIKDIKTVMKGSIDAGGQQMELQLVEMKKSPSSFKQMIVLPAMNMTVQKQVFNGKTGYNEAQGQKADMTEEEKKDAMEDADIAADLHPEKYGVKRTLSGMDKVNGNDVYVLAVENAKGGKSKEYYDAATFFLVKKVESQTTPQGDVVTSTEYSEYKDVTGGNGYKLPYKVVINSGGQVIPATVQSVDINKGIADTEFE